MTYVLSEGEKVTVTAPEGDNLLDIVINNDIDIDGFGACEGTLACSTCHVVLSQEDFDRLPALSEVVVVEVVVARFYNLGAILKDACVIIQIVCREEETDQFLNTPS